MTENIEQRINDTKFLFGEGIFGLVFGAVFYAISILGQNANAMQIHYLSIVAMGLGVAVMLYTNHHIKWLTEQTKQTSASTSTYWAKI